MADLRETMPSGSHGPDLQGRGPTKPDTTKSEFMDGLRECLPVLGAVVPFGAVFGAIAVDKGLQPAEIILMSALVYAGASQYVAMELWATPFPYVTMIVSVFAVNFRHILYSASIGRKLHRFSPLQKSIAFFGLVDPQWAVAEKRAASRDLTVAFYAGMAVPLYCVWVVSTAFGVMFGRLIENPAAFGLDFLLPIYFLTLLMGFRSRPRWLPVVIVSASVGTLFHVTVGPPWHVAFGAGAGILLAAIICKQEDAGKQEGTGKQEGIGKQEGET